MHEETVLFRNDMLEAKADNEQLNYKIKDKIAELREERRQITFPATQPAEQHHRASQSRDESPRVRRMNIKNRTDGNRRRRAAPKGPQASWISKQPWIQIAGSRRDRFMSLLFHSCPNSEHGSWRPETKLQCIW